MQRWWIVLPIVGVLLIVAIILTPQNISKLSSHPNPVQSYDEALQRIEGLRAQESSDMLAVCRLQLLTHDQKVERAIILVHGYTNCPQQFYALGEQFYDAGYNVLMVPLPHHGLADRMTEEHAQLKAEELAAYADETVDIAQGLGEEVVMMGISAGGVTTSWAAQNRSDVDLAVIISPAFGFKQIPTPLTAAVMNIYTFLPDEFVWWDPVMEGEAPPPHAYPRYSKHALVQTLRLGFATQAAARRAQPAAGKIVVVLNPNDSSVNNELTMDVAAIWQAHGADLSTYEFEAELDLGHDLIDPTQPDQKIDIVYPRLIEIASQ
ncbi:MAG: alpha/beta fold hydrolase [Anaerolineae bacterium]|nr:alpha/beta fold hydrolase [Anaerolineae bacterium]